MLHNVLLWCLHFNLKFYKTLIDANIFDINNIGNAVIRVLISDTLKMVEIFENLVKSITKEIISIKDEDILKHLKENLSVFD